MPPPDSFTPAPQPLPTPLKAGSSSPSIWLSLAALLCLVLQDYLHHQGIEVPTLPTAPPAATAAVSVPPAPDPLVVRLRTLADAARTKGAWVPPNIAAVDLAAAADRIEQGGHP